MGQPFTFDPNDRAVAGKFDFIGMVTHEISEMMGRIGNETTPYLIDLFRYSGPGVRVLGMANGVYFSIDGGNTLLKQFNPVAGADTQDWADGTNDSFNAFATSGVALALSAVDLRVMDVLGYNPFERPTVTSPAATNIGTNGATLGGNVIDDGGYPITERGLVYSVTAFNGDPVIGGSSVTKASTTGTTGAFTVDVASLANVTGYSFKAYAISNAGTSYSPLSTFSTIPPAKPTVTTPTVTAISASGAILGGNVTDAGTSPITEIGVCYALTSSNPNPQPNQGGVTKVTTTGTTGVFTVPVSGLGGGGSYSFRAYALSAEGYGVTGVGTFTTPTSSPVGTTLAATAVNGYGATLNGTVNANGSGVTNPVFFIGTTTAYEMGYSAATPSSVTGSSTTSVSYLFNYGAPHTVYHYRVGAFYSGYQFVSYGTDATFDTGNTAPVAPGGAATVSEDSATLVDALASDADQDNLTFTVVTQPAHGTLAPQRVYASGSYIHYELLYTPAANYNGADSFTYTASDAYGGTSPIATMSLTIVAVNDPPTIAAIPNPAAINEDSGQQTVSLTGIGTGASNETQTLTVTATSSNPALIPNPTVTYSSPSATGSLKYTPVANAHGTAVITVTVQDSGGTANGGNDTASTTFSVTVNSVNDLPVVAVNGGGAAFSTAGSLATTRYAHTATLLSSGKVLVAGGYRSGSLASAELYDPATNTWSAAASLATARRQHTATLLSNGKVLVAGGYGGSNLASAELYDPATNTWSAAGSLATARYLHTATLLSNGKVLVAGGSGSSNLASAELYDPATNTWSAAGNLATARVYHTATLLSNGKVLVVGGSGGSYLASAELYDPATNTWSAGGNLATARYQHTATLLSGGKVLVAGGQNNSGDLASAELYGAAEGSAVTQTGTFSDADGNATVTLTASSGTVTQNNAAGTWTWTAPAGADGPATSTITITATDNVSATATVAFAFTVTNTAPTVAITAPATATTNVAANFTFTATDPSTPDQTAGFAWTLNYGDGTGAQTVTAGTASPLARTYTFTTAGTFNVTATATDKDGGVSATATKAITVTSDTTAPTLTAVTMASSNANSAQARTGDVITLSFTANEPIQAPTVSIAGRAATAANGSGNTWTAAITVTGTDTQGATAFSVAFKDLANNNGTTVIALTSGSAVAIDRTPPVVTPPGNVSLHATSPAGAVVSYAAATATDNLTSSPTITYSQASGTTFAPGTVTVTVTVTATDDAGNPGTATFTVTVTPLTSTENWRYGNFGTASNTGNAADMATPSGDGIPNLLKFAFGMNPLLASTAGLPTSGVQSFSGQKYVTFTFKRALAATDVTCNVDISGNLAGSWNQGSSYSPANGDVLSNAYTTQVSRTNNGDGVTETIVVRDNVPLTSANPFRCMHLRVTRP